MFTRNGRVSAVLFSVFFVFTATETAIAQVPWPECPASNPNDICLSGQPYHFRDTRSPNNVNFTAGDRLVLGAEVQPNPIRPAGSDGSGTALIAQQSTTGPILLPFFGNSAFPDDFGISVAYVPGLTGSWQITIENPQSSNAPVVVNTPEVGNAGTQEFVKNMKLSGAGTTPTLSWTYPAGFVPDAVQLRIYDHQQLDPQGFPDIVHREIVPVDTIMFEVPSTLNLSGDGLVIGNLYTFNVSADEIVSDDPDFHGLTHTVSRSRSFFEFVPVAGSVPDVFLPMVGPDNVYHFEIIVEEGQPIIVDPEVAVGYDFMIGDGDPNFASVTLPTVGGDEEFALYLFDAMLDDYIFADDILAGGEHEFGADGVDRFRILGIDPAAMLDPNDVLAFQTTLTFVSDGEFTGTMTPITAEVTVSEPATLVLLGFGLGWLGLMRRRQAA